MSDLISRQKILDFCNGILSRDTKGEINIVVEVFKAFAEYVKCLPTEKKASEWIPISLDGELPEEEQICLVCGKNGGMCVARFCERGNRLLWTKTGTGKFVYPVAWMPLPEPFKGEK